METYNCYYIYEVDRTDNGLDQIAMLSSSLVVLSMQQVSIHKVLETVGCSARAAETELCIPRFLYTYSL
jgi:hypothetical protein